MRVASLVLWIIVCQGVGLLGARWTAPAIPAWYATLRKPSFNPPNWIFGPVWTLLYLLMAVAAWRVTQAPASSARTAALALFGLQLALNLAWSWIFFGLRKMPLALVEIAAMWAAIAATTLVFVRVDAAAAWLMTPYWAWVTFAAILNAALVRLNR